VTKGQYHWIIELDFQSIKSTLNMDILRCQSPEMVEEGVWMHLPASNLIRGVMAQAARADAAGVSFTGAWQTIKAFQESLGQASPAERERLVAAIAGHRWGIGRGASSPWATKRRPKKRRHLAEPGREARERLMANA
jgi:hypothetical protein